MIIFRLGRGAPERRGEEEVGCIGLRKEQWVRCWVSVEVPSSVLQHCSNLLASPLTDQCNALCVLFRSIKVNFPHGYSSGRLITTNLAIFKDYMKEAFCKANLVTPFIVTSRKPSTEWTTQAKMIWSRKAHPGVF
ncbi:hypothetical protein J6590_023466, partial [Homalodisca vitripennis]